MNSSIRWGIIGTGGIAGTFATALKRSQHGTAVAVASRTVGRAETFAAAHGIPRAHGSYADLCADPEVDAVYIATPHTSHLGDALAAIAGGKHVLCEKPLAVTVAECDVMIAAARAAGVVLLEAFMYRTHPQTRRIQQLLKDGAIGTVRSVRSCFTYGMGPGYNVRLDPVLRGGSLYDVGCYCIDFSRMVAGAEPIRIATDWKIDPATGVDEVCAAVLGFPSGLVAHFDVGLHSAGSSHAEILGERGRIVIPNPWKPGAQCTSFTLAVNGRGDEEIVIDGGGDIYALEADHLADVVHGTVQPLIPGSNAVGTVRVLEAIWTAMRGTGLVRARSPDGGADHGSARTSPSKALKTRAVTSKAVKSKPARKTGRSRAKPKGRVSAAKQPSKPAAKGSRSRPGSGTRGRGAPATRGTGGSRKPSSRSPSGMGRGRGRGRSTRT